MAATDWFTQDRFGMFIHFGLYSNPAGVWNGKKNRHPYSEWLQASEHVPRPEYQQLAEIFNPDKFGSSVKSVGKISFPSPPCQSNNLAQDQKLSLKK